MSVLVNPYYVIPPVVLLQTDVIDMTGIGQSVPKPGGATYALVKLWGNGGSGATSNGVGGGGGYLEGLVDLTAIDEFTCSLTQALGNGTGAVGGGDGGGYCIASALLSSTPTGDEFYAGAGGGGGTGSGNHGGAGGGTTGATGAGTNAGTGGSQVAGGASGGLVVQGGIAAGTGRGGGGFGFYGGGAGQADTASGGGGSNGTAGSAISNVTTTQGSGQTVANAADPDYVAGHGNGGDVNTAGELGLIVINWYNGNPLA